MQAMHAFPENPTQYSFLNHTVLNLDALANFTEPPTLDSSAICN